VCVCVCVCVCVACNARSDSTLDRVSEEDRVCTRIGCARG
jgi:hypothetical protein